MNMKDSTLAMVVFVVLGVVIVLVYFMMGAPQSLIPHPPIGGERTNLCDLLKWYNFLQGRNACEVDLNGDWVCKADEIACYDSSIPIDCDHPAVDVFFDQCVAVGAGAGCNSEQLYCMYND